VPRLLRLSRRDRLPVYEQTRTATLIDPYQEVRLMGRHFDDDGDGRADQADQADVHPLKRAGEPMRYRRDVRRDEPPEAIAAETEHVREHLAMVADYDDDPTTHAADVVVRVLDHIDGDPELISIVGELDAEPDAPYLRPGYDPDADDDGLRFTRYSEEGQE
jgi:hypothetical protein